MNIPLAPPLPTLAAALFLGACAAEPPPASKDERPVTRLAIEPATLELPRGLEGRLSVAAWDAAGRPIDDPPILWRSLHPEVAAVDEGGAVRALSTGAAEIEATADGARAIARVEVREPRLASLTIEPRAPRVEEGRELRLEAVIRDEAGEIHEGLEIQWASEKPLYAAVDDEGVVRGLRRESEATITARHGSLEDRVVIRVLSPLFRLLVEPLRADLLEDEEFSFTATPLDAELEPMERSVRWRSEDEAVATVDEAGRVRARGPGETRVFAETDEKSSGATVSVAPRATTLEVRLAPASILPGGRVTPRALARDRRGEVVEGLALAWQLDAPGVADLLGAETVEGVAPGEVRLIAANERHGVEGSATLRVLEPGELRLSGPPGEVFLAGDAFQLHLEVETASGERRPALDPVWFTSDEAVAAIDEAGRVEIVGLGQATVGVRAEGFVIPLDRPAAARFEELALGEQTSCGRVANGTVWCWGRKVAIEGGEVDFVAAPVPERVGDGIVSIRHGRGACETFPEAGVVCDLSYGLRGDGSVVALHLGLPPLELAAPPYLRIAAAGAELCGITAAGEASCRAGLLHPGPLADLLLGPEGRCLLGRDGAMGCAGEGPFDVDLGGRSFAQGPAFPLSLASGHGCGVDAAGEAFCWGENESAQIRTPADPAGVWVDPTPLGSGVRSVAAAEGASLFVSAEGELSARGTSGLDAWLEAFERQGEIRAVHAGPGGHRCLLLESGRAYCWGRNELGQAGHAPQRHGGVSLPVALPASPFPENPALVAREMGGDCVLTHRLGEAYCPPAD